MLICSATRTSRHFSSRSKHYNSLYIAIVHPIYVRHQSNDAVRANKGIEAFTGSQNSKSVENSALARLPTSSILRSLILGTFFTTPILFAPGFALMRRIADSTSAVLNPDRNPVLRAIIKPMVYDQFCAGTNKAEIQESIARIKSLGFSGVILCYGKEIQIAKSDDPRVGEGGIVHEAFDQEIEAWKQGNLETLGMVGEGDWLGIKYTGAGKAITEALLQGDSPPEQFVEAMVAISEKALSQNCRIWIDAEQQVLQHSIDLWTIDFMRRFNRNGNGLIYNTLQAYLKKSRQKLEHQLGLAKSEGWTLAIKLVRGAYINNDIRERIHDTKADTDASYNGIVKDLISGTVPGFSGSDFPKMQLFLAGHNPTSVTKASQLIRELASQGQLKTLPDFGQLQGMADELGCKLLNHGEEVAREAGGSSRQIAIPRVYKCLTWGTVQECMQYLVRRAVENRGGTEAMKDELPVLAKELRRRISDTFMGRRSKAV